MKYFVTISNNTSSHVLEYQLLDISPAKKWAKMVDTLTPNQLRPTLSPWRGLSKDLGGLINELNLLIDEMNLWVSETIPKFDSNDTQNSLNRLHIDFPHLVYSDYNETQHFQMLKFNDLIHGIEISSHALIEESFRLALYFSNPERIQLELQEYKYFTTDIQWGDLMMHYSHTGKGPWALMLSNDTDCPKNQIVPQTTIAPQHTLRFHTLSTTKQQFEDFNNSSGLEWPYELNDPRLAVGYIKLGSLLSMDKYITDKEIITETVKSCNKIDGWVITAV